MAEDIGALVVRIETKLDNFDKGLQQAAGKVNNFGSNLEKIGKIVASAFVVDKVVEFGKHLITTASDAAEMQSKFNTVFGGMSQAAEAWATKFRNSVGGSKVEIKDMMAATQDLMTGFGATTQQAFDFSTKIQSLGTDLASFQNIHGGAKEAVERLRSGLMGETENLKALGIVINDTTMKQALASQGDKRSVQDLSELEKMHLRYQIAVSQSKNAIGDAEKTSSGFANQMRNLTGQAEDAAAKLGERLLPKATEFVTYLNTKMPDIEKFIDKGINALGNAFQFVKDKADILIPAIAGVTAAIAAQAIIGAITNLYNAWKAATVTMTTVQWLLNAAMNASPFGIVATAIGLLIAAGIALYQHWDVVKAKATEIWGSIKKFVGGVVDDLGNAFKGFINGAIDGLNGMIRGLNKLNVNLPDWVGGGSLGFNIPQIPKLATGTNFVPFDTMAFIHKGEAVVPANNNPSNPNANNPVGGSITNNFSVENMNVRSDNDIKSIAKELYNLQQSRSRGNGVIAAV